MSQPLLDRQAVLDTLLRLAAAFDEHDWPAMRACLAAEVETDYRSFRGSPPARLAAATYIEQRQRALAGLRTQHLCLNPLIAIAGDEATCRADFVIHRWPADPADPRFFHSYGFYRYALRRTPDGWRVSAITQVLHRSEGDPTLHGATRGDETG